MKQLLAAYQQSEDLITIGAYQMGSNQLVDLAIKLREPIDAFSQSSTEHVHFAGSVDGLMRLARLRNGVSMPDDRQTPAAKPAPEPAPPRPAARPPAAGAKP